MTVVPLVLAAGASTRMGRPKAALPVGGVPALRRVLQAAAAAGLGPAVVVSGADPTAVRDAAAGADPPPRLVEHPGWAQGRTSSLQAGLLALPPGTAAFLLWPVDVCLVGPEVVRALLEARREQPAARAWVPSHAGRRGHPALFASQVTPAFLALGPDAPAREVLRALAGQGAVVHVPAGEEVLRDLDTPADLAAAEAWLAR